MKRIARPLDWLAYTAARLGWPGLLGLGLLLATLALDHFLVQPLETVTAELDVRADRLARKPRPSAVPTPPVTLLDRLPAGAAAPEGVAQLFAAASHAGLSLEQGSYRPAGNKDAALRRYQITLPVSGEYPALRAFLAEALERQPSMALDSLILTRESIASPLVKAKLNLTLYLREAP
jgi:hypothetical protein